MIAGLGRFAPHLAIAAVVMLALAKADHNGATRAKAEADRDRLQSVAIAAAIVNGIGRRLDEDLAALELATNAKISTINQEDRTLVQPIIQRELARDPALYGRQCLTPELLRAINISRGVAGAGSQAADLGTSPPGVPETARAQ